MILKFTGENLKLQDLESFMCIHLSQAILVVFRGNIWGKGNIPLSPQHWK